jgi:signal recognition particle receptor subunit beta
MVQINFALKEVNCKVVYYGPGMSGKTTNLEIVHKKAPEQNRGELTSISTDGDRTLFFDYMPLDLGTIAGMRTKFQLYTVPGQVYYNSTRKLVLQGVDGVVFVADSDPSKMNENMESFANLEENLREYGKDLRTLPHVIQWNKRDLPGAMTVADLNAQMNKFNAPNFEAVARTGEGVFHTLKALAAAVLESLNRKDTGTGRSAPAAALPTQGSTASPAARQAPMAPVARPAAVRAASPAPAAAAAMRQAPAMPAVRQAPSAPVARPASPAPKAAPRAHAAPAAQAPAPARRVVKRAVAADEPAEEAEGSKPSKSVAVGMVVGALAAVAVLGVVFLFLFR